jgi:3-phenylpropionate/cinnamic acid dioxygenase small subunit
MAFNKKIMKKILTIFLLVTASGVYAQNWKEWTQQKKTQIKYLVNQIAALQIYATYVEKGYAIAKKD